jgi:hypothetical protein
MGSLHFAAGKRAAFHAVPTSNVSPARCRCRSSASRCSTATTNCRGAAASHPHTDRILFQVIHVNQLARDAYTSHCNCCLRSFFFVNLFLLFSATNLVQDIYLRQQMDENGRVPLTLIANFYRVRLHAQHD